MRTVFLSIVALVYMIGCTPPATESKSLLESMEAAQNADEGRALLAKFFSETSKDEVKEKLKKFGNRLGKAMIKLGMPPKDFEQVCDEAPENCADDVKNEEGKTVKDIAKEQGASPEALKKFETFAKKAEENKRNEEAKKTPETEATMLTKISWKHGNRTSLEPNFIKQVNESANEIHAILTNAKKQQDYYKQSNAVADAGRNFGVIGINDMSDNKNITFKKDIYVLEAALKYLVSSGKYRAYMQANNGYSVELAKGGLEQVLKNKADRREIDSESINRVHAFMSKHEITDKWTETARNEGLHNSLNAAFYDYAYANKNEITSIKISTTFMDSEKTFLNKQLAAAKFYAWAFTSEGSVGTLHIAVTKDDAGIDAMKKIDTYSSVENIEKK